MPLERQRKVDLMDVGVAAATADGLVRDTTTQTFRKDVLEESRRQPVLVDFWAPWWGPCKQLKPILEKAVRSANVHALAGLARSYLETGSIEEAKHTLAQVPEAKRNDTAVAAARAALEVAEQAAHLGPVAELEQKVAANPRDHQARFDLAIALNGNSRRQEALDQLLEIVRRDRKWNDDAARKQLVQFFEAWGPTDEHTVSGRRRLSSILFA